MVLRWPKFLMWKRLFNFNSASVSPSPLTSMGRSHKPNRVTCQNRFNSRSNSSFLTPNSIKPSHFWMVILSYKLQYESGTPVKSEACLIQHLLLTLNDNLSWWTSILFLADLTLKPWHAHTRRNNPAADVMPEIRRRTAGGGGQGSPELLTQVW